MKLLSEQAIRDDIETLNSEIASLTAQRDALQRVLVLAGIYIVPEGLDKPQVRSVSKPKPRTRPSPKPGQFTPYSCEELRDVVVTLEGEFTLTDLAATTGRDRTTVEKYLHQLIERDIVTDLGKRTTTGRPRVFKYNTDIPPGPNSHPHEPTPESQAVGATHATGQPVSQPNGIVRVSDTMIQGFINAAIKQGWLVTWKDGTHLKFANPDGRTVGVNSKPPSKQVGLVIKRDLKRSGLVLA